MKLTTGLSRSIAWIATLGILSFSAGFAQESRSLQPPQPLGNPFSRFLSNYTTPQVRTLEVRGESSLEAMIKNGKLQFTEEDVVRLALENNVDINIQRYAAYFSLWGIEKGRAVLNPSIAFSTNVNRVVTPATSILAGGESVLNLTTLWDVAVHKPFAVGFDLDVDFNTRRVRSNNFFTNLNPSLNPVLSLTVTQHLLKDFGPIARGRFVRIGRNNYNISQEEFAARASDIVAEVLNAYWDLVFRDEDLKLKEASRRLAETVLEQNKIQAQVGTLAPLDVVQAESEVATRNEQLVTSRFNRRVTEDQLKKLISSRLDPGLIAAAVEPITKPPTPPAAPANLSEAIQRALETRPEIRQQQWGQENRKIQIDYTRNQLRPTLDLAGSYLQNGLGGVRVLRDFSQGFLNPGGPSIVSVTPGGFGDALDSLFSLRFLGYVVGLNFRIPIGNDEARANYAQAQIDHKQGEERLRSFRQRIALEVRQAYETMEMNRAQIEAAQATVRYSESKLQGEQDKYSLGVGTTRFVLEAQRDLQDAQTRLARARIDLVKSRIAYDKAVGDILSAHNIELQQALGSFK